MRDLPSSSTRVLVIGGGVAGSSAAIRFAQRGVDVTLVERDRFPREKVCGCCLGAAGLAALDAIGCGELIRDIGQPLDRFEGWFLNETAQPSKPPIPIRLTTARGLAISRGTLDQTLVEAARRVGVRVRQPVEARLVATEGDREKSAWVSCREAEATFWEPAARFDLVVVATGLTGPFRMVGANPLAKRADETLPWQEPPHGPLGLSIHLPMQDELTRGWSIEPQTIQMICGQAGYVGVVRLPGGTLDIAAAILPRQSLGSAVEVNSGASVRSQLVNSVTDLILRSGVKTGTDPANLRATLVEQARWMTTPPLRRRRTAGAGRVVAIGDALSYVEPLTGEGMTWGIESGIAVADLWDESTRRITSGELASLPFDLRWQRRARSLQSSRRRLCGWVTVALRNRPLRIGSAAVLHRAHWLAGPLTWNLARGPQFAVTSVHGH